VTKPQVSRRIPVVKLPVKAAKSSVRKDVGVSGTGASRRSTAVSVSTVTDISGQRALTGSKNIGKKTGLMKTAERRADDHRDVAKKPRLKKPAKDSLASDLAEIEHTPKDCLASDLAEIEQTPKDCLASDLAEIEQTPKDSLPSDLVEAERLQNIARLGAECPGDSKPAKLTYVDCGRMSLPLSVLSSPSALFSSVSSTGSYALYMPFTDAAQCPSIAQSSTQPTASYRPATSSTASQTADAAAADDDDDDDDDDADAVCSMDSSVVDTEVVETAAAQSSQRRTQKRRYTSSFRKLKHTADPGRYLLKYQHCVLCNDDVQFFTLLLLLSLSAVAVLSFFTDLLLMSLFMIE